MIVTSVKRDIFKAIVEVQRGAKVCEYQNVNEPDISTQIIERMLDISLIAHGSWHESQDTRILDTCSSLKGPAIIGGSGFWSQALAGNSTVLIH